MAKLNGITVLGEVIVRDGIQYAASESSSSRSSEVGDIVKFDDTGYSSMTRGAYYEVKRKDRSSDGHVIDDDGDDFDLCGDKVVIYKPVTSAQNAPTTYKEVKRRALVGETIKIVNRDSGERRYGNGATGVVTDGWGGNDVKALFSGLECGVIYSEYVVLEPVKSTLRPFQAGDIVRGKSGSLYTLGNRKPENDGTYGPAWGISSGSWIGEKQITELVTPAPTLTPTKLAVGDYIKVIAGNGGGTKSGDIAKIRSIDSDGDFLLTDLSGKSLDGYKLAKNVVKATDAEVSAAKRALFTVGSSVKLISGGGYSPLIGFSNGSIYEIVGERNHSGKIEIKRPDGINNGFATPDQLTLLSDLEVAALKPKPVRLKVGEYAKVVGSSHNDKFNNGNIVKITEDDKSSIPYRAELAGIDASTSKRDWFSESSLVAATQSEIDAVLKPSAPSLKSGDNVRLTIADGKTPNHGYGSVKNGDIGVVNNAGSRDVYVNFPAQSGWHGLITELTLITETEAAAFAETAKWKSIGRQVGEYRVGDTVKLVGETGYNGLRKSIGIITTIDAIKDGNARFHLVKPAFIDCDGDTWTKGDVLEMVKPI